MDVGVFRHKCAATKKEMPWVVSDFYKSVFGKSLLGSAGYQPVPSGHQPDGTRATVRIKDDGLSVTSVAAVPVGRLPTGASKLPALPIFKTRSNRMVNAAACAADWEKLPSEH